MGILVSQLILFDERCYINSNYYINLWMHQLGKKDVLD